MTDDMLTKGARRSSLGELPDWTEWTDQVLTF
jgi:sulfur relay (sulfurtransferase) complex TusBCD TusD component (DsrE family)